MNEVFAASKIVKMSVRDVLGELCKIIWKCEAAAKE